LRFYCILHLALNMNLMTVWLKRRSNDLKKRERRKYIKIMNR